MKASELRQSILQAAVQGKLVPQNVHDEPASVLLENIRAEKARLVKEGLIKKEKPLPPIMEDEIPYDLPEGWVWCRLGDLFYVRSSRRVHQSDWRSTGIPFYRAREIARLAEEGFVNNDLFIDPVLYERYKNESGVPQEGDLMVTAVGTLGKTYIVKSSDVFYYKDASVICLCNFYKLNSSYFKYLMNSPTILNQIKSDSSGTTVSTLTIVRANNYLVPLPPLEEQQRIVAKVDELMVLCDELELAEQELDALERRFEEYLPKSILQAAVQGKLVPQDLHDEPAWFLLERIRTEKARLVKEGKIKKEKPLPPISEDEIPYDLPEGWIWCRLGDISIINPRNNLSGNTKVSFVPMALISNEYFKGHEQEIRTWDEVRSNFTHFAENDVALAKITPCFENGKSCIMTNLSNGYGAGTTELHIIRCIDIIPQYMLLFLKTPEFIHAGKMNMTGTAGQQRVPAEYLKKCLFPLPPLAEQQRIVAKVNELMALCEEIRTVTTKPIEQRDTNKVINFPAVKQERQILLAARGGISTKSSRELIQAIDDMFAGDE